MADEIRIPESDELSVSTGVIQALATLADTPPTALPPLYNSINPEVFDAVFEQGTGDSLRFTYDGAHVHIRRTADGLILARDYRDYRHS